MIDADLLKYLLAEKQREARNEGIEVSVFKMYDCFFEHHKERYGTLRHLTHDYFDKMRQRQDYCLQQIDAVIGSKRYYKVNLKND